MHPDELSPTAVIEAAANRLAGHMQALRDAHNEHNVAPGPHDDLTAPAYTAASARIYAETLSAEYLRRVGLTFGATATLMDFVASRNTTRVAQPQWAMVRQYFTSVAEQFAPDYRHSLTELPSLVLATQQTPPIVRFDLLAGLASRAGVLRMIDAASWVVELVAELPHMNDAELDTVSLAALVAGRSDQPAGRRTQAS